MYILVYSGSVNSFYWLMLTNKCQLVIGCVVEILTSMCVCIFIFYVSKQTIPAYVNVDNCPGDVFHPDFSEGRAGFFDVTVRNSLLPIFITNAAINAGAAAEAAEASKDIRHEAHVVAAGGFLSSCCGNSRSMDTFQPQYSSLLHPRSLGSATSPSHSHIIT